MKNIGLYPRVRIDTAATRIASQAGAVGLDRGLSQALQRWRKPLARHDPGKIVTDLAIALAVGRDCLADVAVLRQTQDQQPDQERSVSVGPALLDGVLPGSVAVTTT